MTTNLFSESIKTYIQSHANAAANGIISTGELGVAPPFQKHVLGFSGYLDFTTQEEAEAAADVMRRYFQYSTPFFMTKRQCWTIYSRVSPHDPYFTGTLASDIPLPQEENDF